MKKENTNQPTQQLTDEQYIEAHMIFEKNVNDQWSGRFVCADGYSVSFAAFGSIRSVKSMIKSEVIDRVLACGHPVQQDRIKEATRYDKIRT